VPDREDPATTFDASRPDVARVYDYLLGGKDNFAADRAVGDQMIASLPAVQVGVRAQRDVLGRVVRFLVGEAGLGQLLDIGSGLPTAENVHEIAQRIEPATRVVYLDNNPVVLSHARALLAGDKATFVADGDLRDPAGVLSHPVGLDHLDLDDPIGLLMCGILHYVPDEEDPAELVGTLYPGACASKLRLHPSSAGPGGPGRGHAAGSDAGRSRAGAVPDDGADKGPVRRPRAGRARTGARPGLASRPRHPGRARSPFLQMACVGVARKP
jgi:hypothetical protein